MPRAKVLLIVYGNVYVQDNRYFTMSWDHEEPHQSHALTATFFQLESIRNSISEQQRSRQSAEETL